MNQFQKDMIRQTSIPLPCGGDTHIDIYGNQPQDFTITTRLPGGIPIHDNGMDLLSR